LNPSIVLVRLDILEMDACVQVIFSLPLIISVWRSLSVTIWLVFFISLVNQISMSALMVAMIVTLMLNVQTPLDLITAVARKDTLVTDARVQVEVNLGFLVSFFSFPWQVVALALQCLMWPDLTDHCTKIWLCCTTIFDRQIKGVGAQLTLSLTQLWRASKRPNPWREAKVVKGAFDAHLIVTLQ